MKVYRWYQPGRFRYDEDDLELIGWHDVQIHALAFDKDAGKILMDMDCIVEWEMPVPPDRFFRFWIAPATVVFGYAYDYSFALDSYIGSIEIMKTTRKVNRTFTKEDDSVGTELIWNFECLGGGFEFKSSSFDLYLRSEPVHGKKQRFSVKERGGYSFAVPHLDDVAASSKVETDS